MLWYLFFSGIGVDDVFVIIQNWDNMGGPEKWNNPIPTDIASTMRHAVRIIVMMWKILFLFLYDHYDHHFKKGLCFHSKLSVYLVEHPLIYYFVAFCLCYKAVKFRHFYFYKVYRYAWNVFRCILWYVCWSCLRKWRKLKSNLAISSVRLYVVFLISGII